MDAARFNFRITAYTPETIPMGRLAEYMAQYAALLGSDAQVHFDRLTRGSTVLRARVEDEGVPKVEKRLHLAGGTDAPADLVRACDAINSLLRADHAHGTVRREGGGQVVKFPGCTRVLPQRIGPIKEAGHLEGEIVRVGGRDRTIHIQLLGPDGETYNLGFNFLDLFRKNDRLGLGYANGPDFSEDDDVWEVFYDTRLTPNLRAGVALQARDEFSDVVFGFRVRTDLQLYP